MSIKGRQHRVAELFKRLERYEASAEANEYQSGADVELLDLAADIASDEAYMAGLEADGADGRALAAMVRGLLSTWRRDDRGEWERIPTEQTRTAERSMNPVEVRMVAEPEKPQTTPAAVAAVEEPKPAETPKLRPRVRDSKSNYYEEFHGMGGAELFQGGPPLGMP